jgi:hypothetical protein
MATFCRHGTLTESCPICRASVESAQRAAAQGSARGTAARRPTSTSRSRRPAASRGKGLTIRREARAADDGFRSPLALGLRSRTDAENLAEELARACGRLATLAGDPPGLYGEVASEPDIEEASWLALLISYIGPLDDGDDPFATLRATRTSWHSDELPQLEGTRLGPRSPHEEVRGERTLIAYRRWAQRAGSQAAAFGADPTWTETQRFTRVYERLALPGLARCTRYDLLVTLGVLGRYPLRPPSLLLSEDDAVARAAKRVFGIGDRLTLERRVDELARAGELPVEAFDLALENWGAEKRVSLGVSGARDEAALARAREALGL